MNRNPVDRAPTAPRILDLLAAIITWAGLLLQFYLMINNRKASFPETIIRFFSYYTILTNILLGFYFSSQLLKREHPWRRFFARPEVGTAVLLYILVVGMVYNTVLRSLWNPKGAQLLADNILHSVNPLVFLVYWWIYVPTQGLNFRRIGSWLWYPFLYCIYALLRGSLSNFYPYFFMDIDKLGWRQVIVNCIIVTLVFLAFALLLIAIGKRKPPYHKN